MEGEKRKERAFEEEETIRFVVVGGGGGGVVLLVHHHQRRRRSSLASPSEIEISGSVFLVPMRIGGPGVGVFDTGGFSANSTGFLVRLGLIWQYLLWPTGLLFLSFCKYFMFSFF